jgi:hypothetical protein
MLQNLKPISIVILTISHTKFKFSTLRFYANNSAHKLLYFMKKYDFRYASMSESVSLRVPCVADSKILHNEVYCGL